MLAERSIYFEMAHRLQNHGGKCRGLHGHSWKLSVGVSGNINTEEGRSSEGMVVDFSVIKDLLRELEFYFDHSTTLQNTDPLVALLEVDVVTQTGLGSYGKSFVGKYGRINVINVPPTSENLSSLWASRLTELLPPEVTLVSVSVKETRDSEVVWLSSEEEIVKN